MPAISPADRGRGAAEVVLASHANRHELEWTTQDEAGLVQRLAEMGLLGGQRHAAPRRMLLDQVGELNAHAGPLLERVWDTAADTDDAGVLGRINRALAMSIGPTEQ